MRNLRDFKIPDFKLPKFKMPGLQDIDEINVEEALSKKMPFKESKKVKIYDVKRYPLIRDMFLNTIKENENLVAILEKPNHKEPYKEITYKEYGEDVIALGTSFKELLGLNTTKRVAIIGETSYSWYLTYMALLVGGIIAVPVDKELPEAELENVLERAKVSAVVYSKKKKEITEKVCKKLDFIENIVEIGSDEEIKNKHVGFNHLLEMGRRIVKSGNKDFLKAKIDPDEFKLLIFTSGTTSKAKGVMISNRNLCDNLFGANSFVKIRKDDRLFSILPLHHTYESTIGYLLPISCGASVAICEGLKYIVPNMQEAKPTALLSVPLLAENLYKKINQQIVKSKKDKLVNSMIHVTNALKSVNVDIKRKVFSDIYNTLGGNLRIIVSAAAPIDKKVGKWLEDIGILFLQGYGLTETAPIAALTPESMPKVGSAGMAVPCSKLKILNPNEDGEGEVLIKSTTLMIGYYEDEEATKEVVKDGWFHTGDIGYLDDQGFLFITGRCKNVIVTQNGKNIYPEELEILLSKIPYIEESMVYGLKKDEKDKELTVSVKVIPNLTYIKEKHGDISKEEIYDIIWKEIKELNRTLVSYKTIKHLEIKEDAFEKTTTMKIKRYAELKKDEEKKKNK